MKALLGLLRQLSIRARMQARIAMVLGMFALVGLAGLQVRQVTQEIMEHSIHELGGPSLISAISAFPAFRRHVAQVRLLERPMVTDYDDVVALLRHRQAWLEELAATRQALETMLEGEEDANNSFARASLERPAACGKRCETLLTNIQNGAYDNARVGMTQQHAALAKQPAAAESLRPKVERLRAMVGTVRLGTGGLAA